MIISPLRSMVSMESEVPSPAPVHAANPSNKAAAENKIVLMF